MSQTRPILHLVCGKAAAGKSTLIADLAREPGTLMVSEDTWLAALYGDEMKTLSDYVRCAARLRTAMAPHVVAVLQAGLSVALDFPANTREARWWMRGIAESAGAAQRLHFLDVPEEVCLARLRARNESGDHPFAVTDEQFARLSKHFEPPAADEGFHIVTHPVPRG